MTSTTHKTEADELAAAERWLDQIDPDDPTLTVRSGQYLTAIGTAVSNVEAAEKALIEAVLQAHIAGDSWAAIGSVLGTSRQAAHRKYA